VPDRAVAPIADLLPQLLKERSLSLRGLAATVGVDPTFLSRAVRGTRSKRLNADLLVSVARALELPPDYFVEFRELVAIYEIKANPKIRDQVFEKAARAEPLWTTNDPPIMCLGSERKHQGATRTKH
jgi:transcriptional regulator with XRE-family HTH domain